jgi:hypothetical protein
VDGQLSARGAAQLLAGTVLLAIRLRRLGGANGCWRRLLD